MIDFEKLKLNKKMLIIILIIAIIGILIFVNSRENEPNIAFEDGDINKNNQVENITEETKEIEVKSDICVHISGEVKNQGIVILEENSRVIDAIEAAGGLTESADLSCVNLAYTISDGIKIYIPSVNEKEIIEMQYLSQSSDQNIIEETSIGSGNNTEKVNINIASKSELESLNGVGPSTAEKIIEYRKLNGKFNSIDEIKNVSGIGNSKFEAMKNSIIAK